MASFKTSGTEVCGDTPVGALTAYCGNFAFSTTNQIDGWVLCDGATYDNTSGKYNTLTSMSIGSSSGTNYISPNLNGRMPLGRDAATNNTMITGGANQHTLNIEQYPSHNHTVTVSDHSGIADHTHNYTEYINRDANATAGLYASDGDNRNPAYNTGNTSGPNVEHTHNNFTSGNVFVPAGNSAYGNSNPFSILNKHVGVRWLLKY